MLRMVPLGETHTEKVQVRFWMHFQRRAKRDLLFLSLNSSTRASSGVMVAHLTPTPYFLMASAESMVTWSSVWSRYSRPWRGVSLDYSSHIRGGGSYQVVVLQVNVEVGQDHLQSPDALVNHTLQPRAQEASRLTFSLISFQMMRVIYNADDSGQHMLG